VGGVSGCLDGCVEGMCERGCEIGGVSRVGEHVMTAKGGKIKEVCDWLGC
jgi:hypothetical protein